MEKHNERVLEFDTKIYPVDAIVGASHKLLTKCFIYLDFTDEKKKRLRVKMVAREGENPDAVEDLFQEEAVEYAMKLKVLKGTAKVRDQVFHLVFNKERLMASTDRLRDEMEEADYDKDVVKLDDRLESILEEIENEDDMSYEDDPLGITVPFEEKHGKPDNVVHPKDQLREQGEKQLVHPVNLEVLDED